MNKKGKCGLDTKTIIRCAYATVILSIVMNSTACKNNDSDSRDSITEQISLSANSDLDGSTCLDASISSATGSETPQSEDVTTSTETTLPTKNPNPSEYKDFLDIPMPCDNQIDIHSMTYNGQRINLLSDNDIYLLFTFGFDNPVLLNDLRSVLDDETITCYEVDYFQHFKDYVMQYSASFDTLFDRDFYRGPIDSIIFELDVARYILEENGLRMWIDEIPYDFFEQKLYNYYASAISLPDDELHLTTHISNLGFNDGSFKDFSSAESKMSESEFNEVISELFYASALRYNTLRYLMIYDLGANQIRNTDGYNVIQFADEKIYNKVREAYKDFYGYDFDPIHNGPETREDLANNYYDIPVEEFDEAAKAIGGVKFARTNPYDQTYDQSNQ